MSGMLSKFVAGAAGAGADIIKRERMAAQEQAGRESAVQLQAQLQAELQNRQNEFLAAQGALQRGTQAEQASMERASRENQAQAELAAREAAAQRAETAAERRHRESMLRLDRAASAAERRGEGADYAMGIDDAGNLLRGRWDQATGQLKAGDKVLRPHQPKDVKGLIDRAKAYTEAGDMQSALKVLDDIGRMSVPGAAGAAAVIDPLKPAGSPPTAKTKGPPEPKSEKTRVLERLQSYDTSKRQADPDGYAALVARLRELRGQEAAGGPRQEKFGPLTPRSLIEREAAEGNEAAIEYLRKQRDARAADAEYIGVPGYGSMWNAEWPTH